jgi:hypothetical protein
VLTWWFSLMSVGGLALGLFGGDHPLGKGVLGHPLVIFFALVAAGLMMLGFLYGRLLKVISATSLVVGFVIAIACYVIGVWFGVSLAAMP